MAKTTTAKARAKPLDVICELLPNITNDELIALVVAGLQEGAKRAWNYMDEDVPRDAVNEGCLFAEALHDFSPRSRTKAMEALFLDLYRVKEALAERAEEARNR